MNESINDAEIRALEEWVNHVDFVKGVFTKFPAHFRNHKERFDRNERALIVFEQAKDVRYDSLMAAQNHALCLNTEHEGSKCWD
jgi:hypothetical protein